MSNQSFAIVCEWPGVNAAENETISRIKVAASLIKKNILVIDKYGNILDENFNKTSDIIQNNDVDFVINLHFASPKCYDGFSYVALWNPVKFYHDWGYKKYSLNLLSHHDFISCLSDPADDHAMRLSYIKNSTHLKPEIVINHTNCNSYYNPDSNRDSIFYCGINWDKSTGKSRFSTIFNILDKQNILKIYGPRKLGKIIPWEGFKSYVDEIPFDGVSTFKEISKCLLGLALSHEAHIESEIASSRVFELIAGGALPICDENPFFKKHFGERVLYVAGNSEEKAEQISAHYRWATQNKDKVIKMVAVLQNYMKENFDLSKQLETLYNKHQERRRVVENQYCSLKGNQQTGKTYHFFYTHFVKDKKEGEDDFSKLATSVRNQNYKNINLTIASNSTQLSKVAALDELGIKYQVVRHGYNEYHQLGLILSEIKNSVTESEDQLFMVTTKYDHFFYDHVSSLVRCFEDKENCLVAESTSALFASQDCVINTNDVDSEQYAKDQDCVSCGVIFKKFPPDFILRYVSFRNYKQSLKSYFGDYYNRVNVVTSSFNTDNDLLKDENYLNKSLSIDYAPILKRSQSGNLTISKDTAYQILSHVKFLSPLLKIREIAKRRKEKRRSKKQNN